MCYKPISYQYMLSYDNKIFCEHLHSLHCQTYLAITSARQHDRETMRMFAKTTDAIFVTI